MHAFEWVPMRFYVAPECFGRYCNSVWHFFRVFKNLAAQIFQPELRKFAVETSKKRSKQILITRSIILHSTVRRNFILTLLPIYSKRVKNTLESIVEMCILINFQDANAPKLRINTHVEIFGEATGFLTENLSQTISRFAKGGMEYSHWNNLTFKKLSLYFHFHGR